MTNIVMYDDVNVDLIPAGATHIAVYADGKYENLADVKKKFPKAVLVTIDVRGSYHNGDVLDVEAGDATNADAVAWFKAYKGPGVTAKPTLYTSASNVASLVATMTKAGIGRGQFNIWSAHYTGKAHICGNDGYPTVEGTQWTDKSHGMSLDQSALSPAFFKAQAVEKHTGNIKRAINKLDAYVDALKTINNTKPVDARVSRMLKTLATQRTYLVGKDK